VVGAGHNGLVCAAYLARAGLRVVVCERSDRIGGACVTESPWAGYRMSTAAHAPTSLDPAVVAELGLCLETSRRDPVTFAPLEGGGGILLWDDDDRSAESIRRVAPADVAGRRALEAEFADAARRLRPLFAYPATTRQVRRALRRHKGDDLFARTVAGSIAEVCEDHLSSEVMRGLAALQGVLGSVAGPRTPGTAYLYLHRVALGGEGAWVAGGMGALTDALAKTVRAAGGTIRLEAGVDRIHLDGARRASGVVLAGGEEMEARFVCSGADPHATVALVERGALAPEFVEDVALLPAEGMVLKVNCALGGLPRWRGMSEGREPGPEHRARVSVAPSIDHLEDACRVAAGGALPEPLACEAVIESALAPGHAPEGKHTLSVVAQYAPYALADGSWEERREEAGDLVLATLERYAPGITDLVEARMVLTPTDLEARFGLTGGHPLHGEMLPDWLFESRPAGGWHRYRTPLAGLYLCGAGAHPGGGISGAPGRNAARAVLEDIVAGGDRAQVRAANDR
jgi:phytoene dehydrogenase-like protein